MSNDILARDFEATETWVNGTQGVVVVTKFGETGRTIDLPVKGGGKVILTPRERRHNSELAYSSEQDFFKNGTLQPITLIEDDKDMASIQDNPNIIGDSEMKSLFSEHWKTFEKRIADINSPTAIRRMISVSADPSVNASVRSVDALKARLSEIEVSDVDDPAEEIEDLG